MSPCATPGCGVEEAVTALHGTAALIEAGTLLWVAQHRRPGAAARAATPFMSHMVVFVLLVLALIALAGARYGEASEPGAVGALLLASQVATWALAAALQWVLQGSPVPCTVSLIWFSLLGASVVEVYQRIDAGDVGLPAQLVFTYGGLVLLFVAMEWLWALWSVSDPLYSANASIQAESVPLLRQNSMLDRLRELVGRGETQQSWVSRLTFWWVQPLMLLGHKVSHTNYSWCHSPLGCSVFFYFLGGDKSPKKR